MNRLYIIGGVILGIIVVLSVTLVLIFTLPGGRGVEAECEHSTDKFCANGLICGSDNLCRFCTYDDECGIGKICKSGHCVDHKTREQVIQKHGLVCSKGIIDHVTGKVLDPQPCFTDGSGNIPVKSPYGMISGAKCYDPSVIYYEQSIGEDDKIINNPSGALNHDKTVLYPYNDTTILWQKTSEGYLCPITPAYTDGVFFVSMVMNDSIKNYNMHYYLKGEQLWTKEVPNLMKGTSIIGSNDGKIIFGPTFRGWIGKQNEVMVSTNSGDTWTNPYIIDSDTLSKYNSYYCMNGSGNYIMYLSTNGKLYINNRKGETSAWKYKTSNVINAGISYEGQVQVYLTIFNVYLSNDYGVTFNNIYTYHGKNDFNNSTLSVSYTGDYIIISGSELYISTNFGKSWSSPGKYNMMCMTPDGKYTYGFVLDEKLVYPLISTDKCKTITRLNSPMSNIASPSKMSCSPSGQIVYANLGQWEGQVISTDYGQTWSKFE